MAVIKEILKECPFCHLMPSVIKNPLWHESHGYHGKFEYYVGCQNDTCKIKPETRRYDDIYKMTEQDCIDRAITDWNER